MNAIDYEAQVKRLAAGLEQERERARKTQILLLNIALALEFARNGSVSITPDKATELLVEIREVL